MVDTSQPSTGDGKLALHSGRLTARPKVETFQSTRTRSYITLSYWVVALACIPYWWHSTTIERHSLPLDDIASWQTRGSCPIYLPVPLELTDDKDRRVSHHVLPELNAVSRDAERCLAFAAANANLTSYAVKLSSQHVSPHIRLDSPIAVTVPDSSDRFQSLSSLFMPAPTAERWRQFSQDGSAVKYSSKYKLVFSLLNENIGKGGLFDWPVSEALQQTVYPLLHSLRDLHQYEVETQVQFYAPLTVEREHTEDGTVIPEDQLKIFVNSAEWNLASAVSSEPVLHFILYVPAGDKGPLLVKRHDGALETLRSFSIPRWGGVVIHNQLQESDAQAGTGQAAQTTTADLLPAFRTFASLLQNFHGLPYFGEDVVGSQDVLNAWRIQALMRERIVQNVREAVQKLGAIARQVDEIQNMRIPKAVQDDVKGALDALDQISTNDLKEAMRESARAIDLATRASFNHEMLAMLYFPDEHKWAVYTPLFGPAAVPLIVALIREIKEYKKRKRARLEKAKTE